MKGSDEPYQSSPLWIPYEPGPDEFRKAWPNEPVMRPFLAVRVGIGHANIAATKLLVDSGSEYTLISWDYARQMRITDRLSLDFSDTVNRPGSCGGSKPWKGWSHGTGQAPFQQAVPA